MPLVKRAVSPVNISQVPVPSKNDNELEYVFNASLCNLMRQLASLSRQANDIFNDLGSEVNALCQRTHAVQLRLRHMDSTMSATIKQQLEPGADTAEAPQLPPYESRIEAKPQTVDRGSMPRCIQVLYDQCEPPPPLSIVNQFRVDGKDSTKMYSDPTFFFELWRKEMLEEAPKTKKSHTKRNRPKSGAGRKKRANKQSQPVAINASPNVDERNAREMSLGSPSKQSLTHNRESDSSSLSATLQRGVNDAAGGNKGAQPTRESPGQLLDTGNAGGYVSSSPSAGAISSGAANALPISPMQLPPPPPMDVPGGRGSMGVDQYSFDDTSPYAGGNLQNLPPPPNFTPYSHPQDVRASEYLPPPPSPPPLPPVLVDGPHSPPIPPPPPIPLPPALPAPAKTAVAVDGGNASSNQKPTLPSIPPARNNLLDSIRRGVVLKPVQDVKDKKESELSTVGKIMQEVERRRLLMQQSNNDSSESSDEWDSDD